MNPIIAIPVEMQTRFVADSRASGMRDAITEAGGVEDGRTTRYYVPLSFLEMYPLYKQYVTG